MAITTTPAPAGYGDIDNTPTAIYTGACTAFYIKVSSSSSESLLVNIPDLHGTEYFRLEANDAFWGKCLTSAGPQVVTQVNVKSASATDATFSWAVAAAGS